MEKKIGEIFEYNGEWYQCLECRSYLERAFKDIMCDKMRSVGGECVANVREDRKDVIFKKLEKVGEPIPYGLKRAQRYKVSIPVKLPKDPSAPYIYYDSTDNLLYIGIKQNKEDMEEYRMYDAKEDIPESDKVVDECLFGEDKLNLKPFDIEAAKAGKPVCTRDGRKARIISCSLRNKNFPIAAIIEDEEENVYQFEANGVCDEHDENLDLMMLPEKKEGWILLRKDGYTFDNEEVAKKNCTDEQFVAKVEWEE